MLKIHPSLHALTLLLGTIASTSQAADKPLVAIQHSVEAQVVFRPWSTKKFGKQIGTESLIVITSPNQKGDMVILRANDVSGGFTAEVYRPDADIEKPDIWTLTFPEDKKSIVKQPDGSFHLSELIDGKEGGRRFEVFRLNRPGQQP